MNRSSIQRICLEAKSALQLACGDNPVFYDALNFINTQNFSSETINEFTGGVPKHEQQLSSAVSKIPDTPFFKLKSALMAGYNQLQWRVMRAAFIPKALTLVDTGVETCMPYWLVQRIVHLWQMIFCSVSSFCHPTRFTGTTNIWRLNYTFH